MDELKRTPLHDLHLALGAKMVPFAGYDMPVQYKLGVMKEHLHTRAAAGLFDVSHMGQVILRGDDPKAVALALETLVPVSVAGLAEGRQRYGLFTNEQGGIEDDLMIANRGDHLFLVVNAACKEADVARLRAGLEPKGVSVDYIEDRALLALQGPGAEAALAALNPAVAEMRFMDVATVELAGVEAWVSRSGYTGEDGYEISVPEGAAVALAEALLAQDTVEPIGLGARDSLRLEAGLCLYGHDIDTTTTPAAANLLWAIQKVRRADGDRAGGFPGADIILSEIASGAPSVRVGLKPEGRAPMREGIDLYERETGGEPVGRITSGGFGPTVGGPVAMGYVPAEQATPGMRLYGEVRGKRLPVEVVTLPHVKQSYKR
ncbi:glycine cleavage system aminomethyltransferase GcvT [Salipiger bermudensis]|uniref:aminomethyltransferase n=1 Tax=Salipiger bermudensis (strain DSM 26914 / JCM 13377 / KCTC 12554 / HTCC2601) TaxID=314265 RepID=Q0FMN0_SALBH|nr:glycine cleavage system aminomethyltransferase GcvT [Salipiger bermudensis]EAU45495.1 probable aminomethyltransferase (glycine cleavage system t protein) [Salipiger bermudensis HTCC2601]